MTNKEAINTLNSLKDYYNDKNEDSYVGFDDNDNEALDLAIKALERPQGKWIDDSKEDSYYANCSHCDYQIDTHYERGYLNYCPNCGADMRGESE